MPVKPDRKHLPEWLKYQMMSELVQAIHRHGIDPRFVPYAWQVLKALDERVTQHVQAITQDFEAALQEMEISRQQAALQKTWL
jgi:predicted component of type VI protein secretion system